MFKPEELLAISMKISLQYTPLFNARPTGPSKSKLVLTSKALLDISQEIALRFKPKLAANTPKAVLLPIDPNRLYVSWNLTLPDKSGAGLTNEYSQARVLRVYPLKSEHLQQDTNPVWFDVHLDTEQTRQTVAIPDNHKAPRYAADIGIINSHGQFTVLAASKVTYNQPHYKATPPFANKASSNSFVGLV